MRASGSIFRRPLPEARAVWLHDVVLEADLLRVLHFAVCQSDNMQLSVSLHFFVHCEQILARLADEMSCLICLGLTAEWMTPRTLCCLPLVSHLH